VSRFVRQVCLVVAWSYRLLAAESLGGKTEVRWEAIAGCPSESELVRQVEGRLGQALDAPREQSLRLHARVHRNDAGEYEVELLTEGASGTGQRRISNNDCTKLAEATALVIAIAIDPKQVERRAQLANADASLRSPSEARPSDAPAASLPTASASAISKRPSPLGLVKLTGRVLSSATPSSLAGACQWSLGARALVGTGVLPNIDLGAMVTASYFPLTTLELRAGAGALLPDALLIEGSGGSISLSAGFLNASVCLVPMRRTWHTHVCAGAEGGPIWAKGSNLDGERNTSAILGSMVTESGFGYRLSESFGVASSVAVGVALLRPKFGVRRNGEPELVYQSESVSVRFGLGVFWELP
jgi:hypothetical protein